MKIEDYRLITSLLLVVIFCLIAIIGTLTYNGYPLTVNIPSDQMVSEYCRDSGFENGYISSSLCDGVNEVTCYRHLADSITENRCVKWVEKL